MCSTDYDFPRLYKQNYRRARKGHSCDECRRTIDSGESYLYSFAVYWDNKHPYMYKTCINCCVPQKWLLLECGGFLHGGLYEEILEHAQEYRKMFLYRWAVNIKRKWKYRS